MEDVVNPECPHRDERTDAQGAEGRGAHIPCEAGVLRKELREGPQCRHQTCCCWVLAAACLGKVFRHPARCAGQAATGEHGCRRERCCSCLIRKLSAHGGGNDERKAQDHEEAPKGGGARLVAAGCVDDAAAFDRVVTGEHPTGDVHEAEAGHGPQDCQQRVLQAVRGAAQAQGALPPHAIGPLRQHGRGGELHEAPQCRERAENRYRGRHSQTAGEREVLELQAERRRPCHDVRGCVQAGHHEQRLQLRVLATRCP
mmetsp:Transcript_3974/g.11014  ORF Transcript_3974/g.11014 Transcript_3974/m.11014 type:complete len:257 (+) Transcript_3974:930-1700(+)